MSKPSNVPATDAAEDGRCYVIVKRRPGDERRRASETLQAIRTGAPPPRATAVPGRLDPAPRAEDFPVCGEAATLDMPQEDLAAAFAAVLAEEPAPTGPVASIRYPDPQLCRCDDMIAATKRRSAVEVPLSGPILFRASAEPDDQFGFPADPWTLAGSFYALRRCPFDGELMDENVPSRERGARGEDGSPYCCAWLQEAHALGKVTLATSKRPELTAWLRFGDAPASFWHCPNCGEKILKTNHDRALYYGRR